ncbi:Uncharacterised protein [Klebsiella pneumoniae]|nr:Uncharacterised protein [Klebsiella pneumoniae]
MVTVNMKLKLLQCGDSGIHISMFEPKQTSPLIL